MCGTKSPMGIPNEKFFVVGPKRSFATFQKSPLSGGLKLWCHDGNLFIGFMANIFL